MSSEDSADMFNELLGAYRPAIDAMLQDAAREMALKCATIAASYMEGGVYRDDLAEDIRKIRIKYSGKLSLADDAVLLQAVLFLGSKQ